LNELSRADDSYRRAIELAGSDEHEAIVHYYFGTHLLRRLHDTERAIPHLRSAHRTLQLPDTALVLGRALVYEREYEEASDLLAWATESADGRQRLIAATSLVDLRKRQAELALEEHNPQTALDLCLEGIAVATEMLDLGAMDLRLNDALLD